MDLEFIERGAKTTRPTLLFIHGAFHDARCWDVHMMPWLAGRGWHCCAVSIRGHGNSPGDVIADNPSLAEMMSDIADAIDHIGGPVILVGHSMGGVIAELVSLTNPNVKGVIMVAPSPYSPAPSVIWRLLRTHPIQLFRAQLLGDDEAMRSVFLTSFFEPDMPDPDREAAESMIGLESRQAMTDVFRRKKLKKQDCPDIPYLIIGGDGDWSIPPKMLEPVAALHDAPLVMVPGPHDLMFGSQWQETTKAMDQWLQNTFS